MISHPHPLSRRPLHLELGCGSTKQQAEAVGIDIMQLPGVDVVADAVEVLRSLPDASVSSIYSEHFMEHIDDPLALLREAARVLKPNGDFRAVIPHFSNPAFYSDPTHRSFFGLYTFSYWVQSSGFRRGVPQYVDPVPLDLISARHVFKSSRPFYVRHALKKLAGAWVNRSRWTQEFYEEHLCWVMPCYEIDFLLRRPGQ
ncbi:methyltransferase domain-containing protein [Blastococcus tunisiensis]|uniref:methyltransferase domain-containing protein n=1 Tax=Blastococcus tunisiensis TaxID=1798228 RepID=UPI000B82D18E|nr:methyltransferase domain-containing protein [Blastococcus sp. DSM 46838]